MEHRISLTSPNKHIAEFPPEVTKEQARACPLAKYQGRIHLIQTAEQVKDAVGRLKEEELLGFDTEKRPTFRVGQYHQPSLLQLAGERAAYVFQLRRCGFSKPLRRLLANPRITKAGVAVDRDIIELKDLAPFQPAGFVDVGELARQAGCQKIGLRSLAARLLGVRISKSCQTSDWAQDTLTPAQIQYAATDAWVGRKLYRKLQSLTSLHPDC